MKRLTECYKLYRELPIFQALYRSLEELAVCGQIPLELLPAIIHQYDLVLFNLVQSRCRDEVSFSGRVKTFRILPDMQWWMFSDVTFYKKPIKGSSSRRGVKLGKFDNVKMWAVDSNDGDDKNIRVEGKPNPYVLEVQEVKKVKKKPKKMSKVSKAKESQNPTFDPLLHIRELSGVKGGADPGLSYLAPMPYNEKLRRGGKDRSLEIAETQLSKIEVLKGRFRKCAREYPYRCVEDLPRTKRMDLAIPIHNSMFIQRKYSTQLRSQDRSIAELALQSGGSLSLLGHNIHVFPGSSLRVDHVRDGYTTRRRAEIELASFARTREGYVKISCAEAAAGDSSSSSGTEDGDADDEDVSGFGIIDGTWLGMKTTDDSIQLRGGQQQVSADNSESAGHSSSSLSEDFSLRSSKLSKLLSRVDNEEDSAAANTAEAQDDDIETLLVQIQGELMEPIKEEADSRSNSLEVKRMRDEKLQEDFNVFNSGPDPDFFLPIDDMDI